MVLLAPPVTAVRGSGILRSSSPSPFPPLSSSLGIRKSTLSLGRPEVQVFNSFLDSRSVGCSSTVRKELGLEKVGSCKDILVMMLFTWIGAIS